MRLRRSRIGCFGCLPFGGLLFAMLPLIAIGAVIWFLVNRQRPAPPQVPAAAAGFCPHCGQPAAAGERFCTQCGRSLGG